MAVNIAGLRRNLKNVAHNYTDAQVKVREATSNDPWGPSSTMMSEIADMTYRDPLLSEIMQMIWKRLNDHGRNWRHVYKALVLLEYLIKTGDSRVAFQCKENIHTIKTLKDFQYFEENKDQGINVREKAKILVSLLSDSCRMMEERARALKAKERFAQSTRGIIISETPSSYGSSSVEQFASSVFPQSADASMGKRSTAEFEAARPQTAGEEELQLQLALAMSREEAEQEETKSKSDDMRLQLAIQKSKSGDGERPEALRSSSNNVSSASSDLMGINFDHPHPPLPVLQAPTVPTAPVKLDAWGMAISNGTSSAQTPVDNWLISGAAQSSTDPWGSVQTSTSPLEAKNVAACDPWTTIDQSSNPVGVLSSVGASGLASADPWASSTNAAETAPAYYTIDPFSPKSQEQLVDFDLVRGQIEQSEKANSKTVINGQFKSPAATGNVSPNPFDLGEIDQSIMNVSAPIYPQINAERRTEEPTRKNTVQSIVGDHSNLVNLDNLGAIGYTSSRNPFEQNPPNPFQVNRAPKPPLNKMVEEHKSQMSSNWRAAPSSGLPPTSDFDPFF